jgi:predicted metalloprotease
VEFDNESVDVSGVQDRRGGGFPGGQKMAIGGGGGLIALIVALLFGSGVVGGDGGGGGLGAIDVSTVDIGAQGGESAEELSQRCNQDGALDQYTDCRLIKTYQVINDTWTEELSARGREYRRPPLVFFSGAVDTACGSASSQVGPLYCPGDEGIFMDLDFLDQLQQQFGATGEFAQAYILAHEAGHHLQTVLGIEPQVRQAQQRDPSRRNELSVLLELQADCLAGVWSARADANEGEGLVLTEADVAEAMNAAAAVGDDRIQAAAGAQVNPEAFTHGSAEQRQLWFTTGLRSGDIASCDTFAN